jgi:chromosome segregation ATPase
MADTPDFEKLAQELRTARSEMQSARALVEQLQTACEKARTAQLQARDRFRRAEVELLTAADGGVYYNDPSKW